MIDLESRKIIDILADTIEYPGFVESRYDLNVPTTFPHISVNSQFLTFATFPR